MNVCHTGNCTYIMSVSHVHVVGASNAPYQKLKSGSLAALAALGALTRLCLAGLRRTGCNARATATSTACEAATRSVGITFRLVPFEAAFLLLRGDLSLMDIVDLAKELELLKLALLGVAIVGSRQAALAIIAGGSAAANGEGEILTASIIQTSNRLPN